MLLVRERVVHARTISRVAARCRYRWRGSVCAGGRAGWRAVGDARARRGDRARHGRRRGRRTFDPGRGRRSSPPAPDGALWFTRAGDDRIGRITTGGEATSFAFPEGSAPFGIVAGPDGALWFTASTDRVGRITLDGEIAEFALPAGLDAGDDHDAGPTARCGSRSTRRTRSGGSTSAATSTIRDAADPRRRPGRHRRHPRRALVHRDPRRADRADRRRGADPGARARRPGVASRTR